MDTSGIDLLELIGRDVTLSKHAAKDGGEYWGACPFCGDGGKGRNSDRFHVWPKAQTPRYWCRDCEKNGDAIQYVRERFNLSYPEALDRLGLAGDNGNGAAASAGQAPVILPRHDPAAPPSDGWQARAVTFCMECEDRLWTPAGARALTWLRNERGLSDATIRAASLGYNPADVHEERAAWDLPPEHDDQGRPKRVWLPRGVVIPWVAAGHLWRVNIRRPLTKEQQAAGQDKYMGPAGWTNALFRADTLTPDRPAVIVEGEFDALAIWQDAGDLVTPVATGSISGARRARWLGALALSPVVLVAFDDDQPDPKTGLGAGDSAAKYWLDVLGNARRWRAYYAKDPSGLATAGGDLRAWVAAGLAVS